MRKLWLFFCVFVLGFVNILSSLVYRVIWGGDGDGEGKVEKDY